MKSDAVERGRSATRVMLAEGLGGGYSTNILAARSLRLQTTARSARAIPVATPCGTTVDPPRTGRSRARVAEQRERAGAEARLRPARIGAGTLAGPCGPRVICIGPAPCRARVRTGPRDGSGSVITARTIASAMASAASAPTEREVGLAAPACRSPARRSCRRRRRVCDGEIARAYRPAPSARSSAPAPWSAWRWWRRRRSSCFRRPRRGARARAEQLARVGEPLPSAVRTPATTSPVAGSTMSPTALTATMRGDDQAVRHRERCRCRCRAFIGRSSPDLADGRARAGADVAFLHRAVVAAAAALYPQSASGGSSGLPPNPEVEQDRRRHDRHDPPRRRDSRCCVRRDSAYALRRVEAVGAAARQHDGVDLVDAVRPGRADPSRACPARRRARRRRRPRPPSARSQSAGRPLGERVMADLDARHLGQAAALCGLVRRRRGLRVTVSSRLESTEQVANGERVFICFCSVPGAKGA